LAAASATIRRTSPGLFRRWAKTPSSRELPANPLVSSPAWISRTKILRANGPRDPRWVRRRIQKTRMYSSIPTRTCPGPPRSAFRPGGMRISNVTHPDSVIWSASTSSALRTGLALGHAAPACRSSPGACPYGSPVAPVRNASAGIPPATDAAVPQLLNLETGQIKNRSRTRPRPGCLSRPAPG